jgi:hypothetical protein
VAIFGLRTISAGPPRGHYVRHGARARSKALHAAEDQADDLRVVRFIDDMTDNKWKADVVMRIGVFDGIVLAIDGIHRGIAYLTCIERGIGPDRLPALRVDC